MIKYCIKTCLSIVLIVGVFPGITNSRRSGLSEAEDDESSVLYSSEEKQIQYTDEVVVQCKGGLKEAHQIASDHDLIYISKVLDDHYLLQVPHRHRRDLSDSSVPDLHSALHSNSKVLWFEQQYSLSRQKRDNNDEDLHLTSSATIVADARLAHQHESASLHISANKTERQESNNALTVKRKMETFSVPNDPLWGSQWYLHRSITDKGRDKEDMNVIEAWLMGYSGKGVIVTIIDDGVEGKHVDLAKNFDPEASYDINDNDKDATPRYDHSNINKHGTRCAGEVAAAIGNEKCVVGVAYNSKVGGIRMLDGTITDSVEARSLSHKPEYVHIYSSSWGPDDDGKTVDGPKSLALKAFSDGVQKGRGGKGSIFVWAAGNGGRHQDDCNCDGYTTSIYTLSIASTTEHELFPWYSERCSSTLASTYSSGSVGDRSIVTTDLKNKCTEKHTGTSASAPLAAGICALALEANANLTWRDMQHIVLRTARPLAKMQPKGPGDAWTRNGAGRLVSHSYGYGLMDAGAMVRLAKQWSTVPPQRECVNSMPGANPIKIQPHSSQSIRIQSTGCNEQVLYLEHVVVIITLKIPTMRGKLSIQLKSPAGTVSQLLFPRNKDTGKTGFDNWQFMSVHHWEETAVGEWEFVFKNDHAIATATLSKIELKLYGTLEDPSKFAKLSGNSTYSHAYAQFSRGLQLFREDSMGSDSRSSFVNNTKSFLCVLVVAAVWLNQRILV